MSHSDVHHGLTYDEYAALEGLRAGELKHLRRSPAHYLAFRSEPEEDKDAFEFGRLFHTAMENPEKFLDLMKVEPVFTGLTKDGKESKQSGEAKAKKAQWYAELPKGTIVIPNKWLDDLTGMIQSVKRHKILGQMVEGGMRETTIQVVDPETGEVLKCRPDLIAVKGYVVDYKTTRDASRGFFTNQIFSDRGQSPFYILGSSHYAHCSRVAKLGNGESFIIAAVEKKNPWGVNIFPIDRGGLEVGESHRAPLTKLFAKCKKEGRWPGYEEKAVPVTIPAYCEWPKEYGDDEDDY